MSSEAQMSVPEQRGWVGVRREPARMSMSGSAVVSTIDNRYRMHSSRPSSSSSAQHSGQAFMQDDPKYWNGKVQWPRDHVLPHPNTPSGGNGNIEVQ